MINQAMVTPRVQDQSTEPARDGRVSTHQSERRTDLGIFLLGCGVSTVVLLLAVFKYPDPYSNDFFHEAYPAYRALIHGHVGSFFQLAPAYVGSLILRAPFALLAGAFGADKQGIYIATALPCLFAGSWLGVWWARERWRLAGGGSLFSLLVLCALNPVVILCLSFGHPEDVLGGALCVAAVLMSARGRAGWAGVLAGLAVVNKSWGLVVVPIVLISRPAGRRRATLAMIVTTAAVMVPALLLRQVGSASSAAATLGSTVGDNFPSQLLYWFGQKSFVVQHAHYLIVAAAVVAALIWWRRKALAPPQEASRQALLLLAMVLLLRAALDPEDNIYYHVPFLMAMMAYEQGRMPRLTILATAVLVAIIPPWYHLSATQTSIAYTATVLPLLIWMALHLYVSPSTKRDRGQMLREARPSGAN